MIMWNLDNCIVKWMNEIIKDYIHQTSCKIVVNKLEKVLTYIIHWQMDEMPHWHFICHVGMCVGIWQGD
jgi:hypothetical protein